MSSTAGHPLAFSRATARDKARVRQPDEAHSTGNCGDNDCFLLPSGGSPPLLPSLPLCPRRALSSGCTRHAHASMSSSCRWWPSTRLSTAPSPVSPTPTDGLTVTRPRETFERRPKQHESDREDNRASLSGQPSLDGSLEAHEREDSAGLLSPPSSQPSFRASLLGSRNGTVAQLHSHESTALFRARSRSRNTTNTGSNSGSGGSSVQDTIHSIFSVSGASLLALGRARAHSLIQGNGGAFRSSNEPVPGPMPSPPPATGPVRLGNTPDVDESEGALSNPESHTFGLPVVGGARSLLPRCGACTYAWERSGIVVGSLSSSSEAVATATFAAAMFAHARLGRRQVASPAPRNSNSGVRSSTLPPSLPSHLALPVSTSC